MHTTLPGGMSAQTFLRDYWQKRPLLIRNAFPDLESPVEPDELAGLACEAEVESRIIIEDDNGAPWQLYNGPFPEERFGEMPPTHWTLLIQGLDHWSADTADLLESFRFIPNWRLDDVMASYAPEGGSVGPHYDQYDVFLVQASGQRHWHWGGHCDEASPRLAGTPLRILKGWLPEEEAVLNPGDMLYLPPGIGHHGIALNDCITLSVGFRAATMDDLITGFSDFICSRNPQLICPLPDPRSTPPENPGLLDKTQLNQFHQRIQETLNDPEAFALWFGQYSTAPKSEQIVLPAEEPVDAEILAARLQDGEQLIWNEGSRFAYHETDNQTALFVDGEQYLLRGDACWLAPALCLGRTPEPDAMHRALEEPALSELLVHLVNTGSLYLI